MTLEHSIYGTKESGINWVGSVPAHWHILPFYAFVDEVSLRNTGLRERNLLSLSYGRLIRKDIDRLEGLTPASFEGYNIIERNDIVFRLTDLQNDQTSLRSAKSQERGIITSAYVTVRPHSCPRFFEYLMRSYDTTKVFYGIGGGIRQSMKFADLKRLPVVVPPEKEMEQIASYLDRATARIDALVAKKSRFIALLRERRQALITHVVTNGLNPGAPMKESGVEWLGKVPKHWLLLPLRAFFAFRNEKNDPIKTGNILSLSIADGVTPYSEEGRGGNKRKEDLTGYNLAHEGDIVLNSMNVVVGAVGRSKYFGAISPVYYALYPLNPNVHVPFFEKIFMNVGFQKSLLCFGKGILMKISSTGQMNTIRMKISQEDLKTVIFPVPPDDEQREIARHIDVEAERIDILIAKTERSIELLREHRTALITAAVTGKIDLRHATV